MIELNLLPEELKKKRKELSLPSIPLLPVIAGILALLVLTHLALLALLQINKNKMNIYNKEWELLTPKRKEILTLKSEIDELERRTKLLETLIKNRILWAKKLNDMSDSLPANIWLAEIAYQKVFSPQIQQRVRGTIPQPPTSGEPVIGVLSLRGLATGKAEESTAYVGRFIKALEENEDFSKDFTNIELGSITKGAFDSQEVMDFSLICSFEQKAKDIKESTDEK